jgi:hypothetical protein
MLWKKPMQNISAHKKCLSNVLLANEWRHEQTPHIMHDIPIVFFRFQSLVIGAESSKTGQKLKE